MEITAQNSGVIAQAKPVTEKPVEPVESDESKVEPVLADDVVTLSTEPGEPDEPPGTYAVGGGKPPPP